MKWNWLIIGILLLLCVCGANAANLLIPNQANACEENTTNGFSAMNGAVLTAWPTASNASWQGSYSLKTVTNNSTISEGFTTKDPLNGYYTTISPGTAYTASMYLRGNGTGIVAITMYKSNLADWVATEVSSDLTLSDTWTRYNVSFTPPATAESVMIGFETNSKQQATIYSDGLQLEANSTVDTWVAPILKYYSYGDSITGYYLFYALQMKNTHDPTAVTDHNRDGNGMGSTWGLANINTHPYNTTPTVAFVGFGVGDRWNESMTGLETAANLKGMYDYYTLNGSTTIVLINTLSDPSWAPNGTYANQKSNITIIQNYLTANSIPFVKMYDAIDSVPENGVPDETDPTLLMDTVHPNAEGHRLMGEYLWDYLVPPVSDFVGTPISGNLPLTVQFSDTGHGAMSWSWDFGDGTTSTLENPSHTYTSTGVFDVTLIVTNGEGSDTELKPDYITVSSVSAMSPETGAATIVAALSLIGVMMISIGSMLIIGMFGRGGIMGRDGLATSPQGMTIGIIAIAIGAVLLFISYAILAPLFTVVGV